MSWINQNWIVAVATFLNALLVGFQVRLANRRNEYDTVQHTNDRFKNRLPAAEAGGPGAFYGLRYRFKPEAEESLTAVNPQWGRLHYHRSLLERLNRICRLSDEQLRKDLVIIEPMVNKLNDLAETIDFRFIDHNKVLAKYHVAIIRDVFIIEPYIYHQVFFRERNRWGFRVLQLGDVARRYNDMNPVHRRNIYFVKDHRGDDKYGPIYPQPDSPVLWMHRLGWTLRRVLFGYPTITQRAKRRQNKYAERLQEDTRHLRRPYATDGMPTADATPTA
jgi:hypothetical protein